MSGLTHIDRAGDAVQVDVSGKRETERVAVAAGRIQVSGAIYVAIAEDRVPKGDVLAAARIAGIQAAKHTWELIPLCHQIPLTGVGVKLTLCPERRAVESRCTVRCVGRTGVEMEALTGVSVSLLTIYDMCKALGQEMTIGPIALEEKDGGKRGHYVRKEPV